MTGGYLDQAEPTMRWPTGCCRTTPQELEIAQRAAGGQTNPEIGGHLFLSPRTVEWHLHKVFGKLGISSRKELRSALSDASKPA